MLQKQIQPTKYSLIPRLKPNGKQATYNIASNIAQHPNEGTNVSVDSKNFTGLLGVKFGEKIIGKYMAGRYYKKLEGEVHLRGTAYNSPKVMMVSLPNRMVMVGWQV